ncbi:MAG TPA: lytic transglycosylase domain-containing protein [Thermoanaerobaculia bacterium]|nr:lytic transglycosylase domain-containing protein [Thermoanaerobaculia bacterium]
MRLIGAGVAVLMLAASVQADVRLKVKKDGTKLIYNVGRGGSGSGRTTDYNWLAKRHDRRSKYDEIIERYAEKYRVDPVLVRAVIQVESDFNPKCVSHKNARGLMQLIPATAERYGVKSVHDPEQNIHGGTRYLRDLLEMFNDDLPRVLAAYNAGEGAVQKHGGIPPYSETTEYVNRALTVYYGRPYGQGAVSFAGKRGGAKLRGGFGAAVAAVALLPGAKYLGTH